MKELLVSSDAGLAARRALTLPESAWPRRVKRSASVLFRRTLAVILVIGAVQLIAYGIWGKTPAPTQHRNLLRIGELLQIVLATGLWSGSPSRIRKSLGALMIWKGATDLYWFAFPSPWNSSPSWTLLVALLAWICVGIDVWRGREWARRATMVLALACYGYKLFDFAFWWTLFRDHMPPGTFIVVLTWFAILMMAGPFAALAIYAVLPSTRAEFADPRD